MFCACWDITLHEGVTNTCYFSQYLTRVDHLLPFMGAVYHAPVCNTHKWSRQNVSTLLTGVPSEAMCPATHLSIWLLRLRSDTVAVSVVSYNVKLWCMSHQPIYVNTRSWIKINFEVEYDCLMLSPFIYKIKWLFLRNVHVSLFESHVACWINRIKHFGKPDIFKSILNKVATWYNPQ